MSIKYTSYVNSLHVFILANITEKQEWLETSCTITTMIWQEIKDNAKTRKVKTSSFSDA